MSTACTGIRSGLKTNPLRPRLKLDRDQTVRSSFIILTCFGFRSGPDPGNCLCTCLINMLGNIVSTQYKNFLKTGNHCILFIDYFYFLLLNTIFYILTLNF